MSIKNFLGSLLFGVRKVPGFFRRFKFFVLAAIVIILLLTLGPWLRFIGGLLGDFLEVFVKPVMASPTGRFIAVNLLLLIAIYVLYHRFKERGRRLVGSFALDRFLSGMLSLASGRYRRALRSFESVLKAGRWVNLREATPVYPDILVVSRIRLALCYRELGDVDRAMKTLELLKVRDLSPARRLDLAEAKAFVYAMCAELMDETVDREIAEALVSDPANPRLLRLRRDRAEERGDLEVAIDAQRRLLKQVGTVSKDEERTRLALLHARSAQRALDEGRIEDALAEISRSRGYDGSAVLPNLLAGDIALSRGDERGAVREWGRTPSLPAFARIAALLREGRLNEEQDLSFLVEEFPRTGILLVLAEHYLETDHLKKALGCLRKCAELGLSNRHTAHLTAEVLRRAGDQVSAERLEWSALKGFLGADAPSDSVG